MDTKTSKEVMEVVSAGNKDKVQIKKYIRDYWIYLIDAYRGSESEDLKNILDSTLRYVYPIHMNPDFEVNGEEYFLCRLGEKIIGFMKIEIKADVGEVYINDLYIEEEFHGRGFGLAMLNFAKQKAVQNSFSKLTLYLDAKNERAYSIYKKFGFKLARECEQKWFDDGGGVVLKTSSLYLICDF